MSVKYTYTKDVVGFSISQLKYEIEQDSIIVTTLDHIDFSQPNLDIYFNDTLSGAEETALGAVVTASPNTNIPEPQKDIVFQLVVGTICGLNVSNNSTNPTYQIDVSMGACRNGSAIHTIKNFSTLTVDITDSGANGLDTGVEASDTWYAIYMIDDTTGVNSVAGLFSINGTTPTLPNGYNVYRRIAWVRNNAASDFADFFQTGEGNCRKIWYDLDTSDVQVLASGSATTYTEVDCSNIIPSTSSLGIFTCHFTVGLNGTASDKLLLRPTNTIIDNSVFQLSSGTKNIAPYISQIQMPLNGEQSLEYKVSDANNVVSIYICGFEDQLYVCG